MNRILHFAFSFSVLVVGCGGGGQDTSQGGVGAGGGGSSTRGTGAGSGTGAGNSNGGGSSSNGGRGASNGGASTSAGGASTSSGTGGAVSYGDRLFVSMQSSAPAVWENASLLAADVAPTFSLKDTSVASGTSATTLAEKRLFFGTTNAAGSVIAFDGADAFAAGAPSSAAIPYANFVAGESFSTINYLAWDATSDTLLAIPDGAGGDRFAGASTLTSSSTASALFEGTPIASAIVYDPTGDRAFLSSLNGGGLAAFDNASGASGDNSSSFTLWHGTTSNLLEAHFVAIDNDTLYAVGRLIPNEANLVAIFRNISKTSAASAPDFTLGAASGLPSWASAGGPIASFVAVTNDVLIVCEGGTVYLWQGASALTGETMATSSVNVVGALKAALDPATDRLYVLTTSSVTIFANATSKPSLVGTVTTGIALANDFALLK